MKYILLWVCLVCLTACESTTYQYVNSCESTQNFSCTTDKPKNIAIFFDGTGNTPESDTNVYKLYQMLSKNSEEKVPSMYIEGVGTEWYRFISGNLFGNGMKPRLVESYKFILNEYKSTDESLYLFGFSRGAYNARALAGLLYTAGLADTNNLNAEEVDTLANKIVTAYLKKGDYESKRKRISLVKGFKKSTVEPRVRFLGVWDSVSALSLKKSNETLLKKTSKVYVDQICNIEAIAHAVSIDDNRGKRFTPELMTISKLATFCDLPTEDLQSDIVGLYIANKVDEVWFSGAHSDVGGGYSDAGQSPLSDVSLGWMLRKLETEAPDFIPKKAKIDLAPDPLALSHIGEESLPLKAYLNWNRNIPWLLSDVVHPNLRQMKVHSSVLWRLKNIPRTFREFAWVPDDMSETKNFDGCFTKIPLPDIDTFNDLTKADYTLEYRTEKKCFQVIEPNLYNWQ